MYTFKNRPKWTKIEEETLFRWDSKHSSVWKYNKEIGLNANFRPHFLEPKTEIGKTDRIRH